MDNAVLTPLMLLHWLFSVEFLVANVALKRSIIPMRSLMDLNRNFSHDEIGFLLLRHRHAQDLGQKREIM